MWSRLIMDPLRGKTPVWKVIWIYCVGVSIVYTILGLAFVPETPTAIGIYTVLGLALGVVQSFMLWKCANNTRFRIVPRLLRIVVIVGLVLIVLTIYVLYTHPEALVLPDLEGGV